MLTIQAQVEAEKADRYFDTLCKHFARKVEVEKTDNTGKVHFPMGICNMQVEGPVMTFNCEAESEPALNAVKEVIESHVLRLGELRGATMEWH